MNTIMEDINEQKQRQYNKAREDLIKAKDSFDKLDNIQKHKLVEEIVGIKAAADVDRIFQSFYREQQIR